MELIRSYRTPLSLHRHTVYDVLRRLHIQVAMTRTKFPEKVPFRLTRMLINAMEGGGIEGTYANNARRERGLTNVLTHNIMSVGYPHD